MPIQEIKFNPVTRLIEQHVISPQPARNYIPEWYKTIPAFRDGKFTEGAVDKTIKMCVPFADSLSFGYIQETWQDITISINQINEDVEEFSFKYSEDPKIMGTRGKVEKSFSIPDEFYDFEVMWHPAWIPELPKGYSALITHPLNRIDLPFYTLSGIIEHDTYTSSYQESNLPFVIKKGFTGLIPKGTPMYQIIPFKRDEWQSTKQELDFQNQLKINERIKSYPFGGYKKHHWVKKIFN